MTNKIRIIFTVALAVIINQFSFAGPTEDLWKALKTADYPNALTAIAAGADVKNLDPAFGTPLNFASCWADAAVVKALIDAGSEINFVAPANGYTPLTNAAFWGNIDAVRLLIAAGANVKIKDKFGQTLLAAAVGSSKLEIIKLLETAGADPNEKYSFGTLKDQTLLNALMGVKEPQEKLTYIKTVAGSLSKMGVTFPPRLTNAQENDFTSLEMITKYLLDKGADANQKSGGWGSLLGQACDMGKTGIVKALVSARADVNYASGEFGRTPLFYACSKGKTDIVQLLADAKADLNRLSIISVEKIYMKLTPLMIASAMGFDDCVEILCKGGADVNFISVKVEHTNEYSGGETYHVKTTYKDTALSFADANNRSTTVALLKKYGALFPKEIK